MESRHEESALSMRALLANARATPTLFRDALTSVPLVDRDAWLDRVLGLHGLAEDGPELPRGCVAYLPCAVDAILRVVELAEVSARDVFVDVGAGLGRAAILAHWLTGAAAIGVEIQPALVRASRDLAARLGVARFSMVEGDAASVTGSIAAGSVFFFYCPFSGARLESVLADLEMIARTRTIRVGCVDLPLPDRPWLALVSPKVDGVAVYRSRAPT
jgi:SAM-dependent methyltransferase